MAETKTDAPRLTLANPTDIQYLAAHGRVAIFHAQLDHALQMLIKSICDLTIEEATLATNRQDSQILRERVRKLARQRLGECTALVKLDALLAEAGLATKGRNDAMHSVLAETEEGKLYARTERAKFKKVTVTTADLGQLSDYIRDITNRIHNARLN